MKKWLIVVLSAVVVHALVQPYSAQPVRVIKAAGIKLD